MTPIMPIIRSMSFEEAHLAGLHSRGLMLEYKGKAFHLTAGTRDNIHVFTRSIGLYVLIINLPLGYIGLDAYMPPEPDPINTIFLHSDYQIEDALGPRWRHLSPRTITTRLLDYLM